MTKTIVLLIALYLTTSLIFAVVYEPGDTITYMELESSYMKDWGDLINIGNVGAVGTPLLVFENINGDLIYVYYDLEGEIWMIYTIYAK